VITLLSLRGFANRCGLAHVTVRRYYAEGRLPPPDAELTDGDIIRRFGWLPETGMWWRSVPRTTANCLTARRGEDSNYA
jgi:hypothetical protein